MWYLFYLFSKNVTIFYISIFVTTFYHYKHTYHNLGNHAAKCGGLLLTLTFKTFHFANTVNPCVLYNSQNKQRICMEKA